MAGKTVASKKRAPAKRKTKSAKTTVDTAESKFPYTTKPGSLRRLLKEIPNKPKPPKLTGAILKSWGFSDNNDATTLRVLKSVNMLDSSGVPTDVYTRFMNLSGGAAALAPEIQKLYEPLFQASHAPYSEESAALKNMFNINSGGSTIDLQINTFKALCEYADFDSDSSSLHASSKGSANPSVSLEGVGSGALGAPPIHINLHIHLPENKSRRDYENIIEDIGRHIFGRGNGGAGGSRSSD